MLKINGEGASADIEAADKFVTDFTGIVAGGYFPENIYNADETGIYWRCLPDTTLVLNEEIFSRQLIDYGKLERK